MRRRFAISKLGADTTVTDAKHLFEQLNIMNSATDRTSPSLSTAPSFSAYEGLLRASLFTLISLTSVLSIQAECKAQSASIAIVDDRSVHVPYEYEVEDGDTLWLLSQEFFNDPWLWPNLWALNPHITNPHWISFW